MNTPIAIAQRHFANMKEIPSTDIILSTEVRKLCHQNACGSYGKNWTCPPAVASLDEFQQKFAAFDTMLIVYHIHPVESSFDWKGMMDGTHQFKNRLLAMKKEIETTHSDFNFMLLGAGGCHLCEPCAYVEGEPCRNPDDAIISLEACGIDVMKLMKDHDMKYYNGKNTVTFIGGMLYKSDTN